MNNEKSINKKLSLVLFLGVIISSVFILLGIFLAFLKQEFNFSYSNYSLELFFIDLNNFNSVAFLMCGIFFLILTPIIRVVCMLIEFYINKNFKYVYISFLVLIILLISFLIGVVHH